MGRIYTRLQRQYDSVLLIGADVPQVNAGLLTSASDLLRSGNHPFVLGPAHDGGFWLFGGRDPLPMEMWTSVTYSRSDTAACFSAPWKSTALASTSPPSPMLISKAACRAYARRSVNSLHPPPHKVNWPDGWKGSL